MARRGIQTAQGNTIQGVALIEVACAGTGRSSPNPLYVAGIKTATEMYMAVSDKM